jgi:hypothetical protein
MHFWIHIEFTNILGQFRPKKKLLIYSWNVILSSYFNIVNLVFINYNNLLNTLLNQLQDHLFTCSIWINFAKENVCQSLILLKNFIFMHKVLKWFGS